MNFSHNYYKLQNKIFTTIRKELIKEGTIEPITLKRKYLFDAKVISCDPINIDEAYYPFLLVDTMNDEIPIKTMDDIEDLFQSFYKKIIDFETQVWYVIVFLRVEQKTTIEEVIVQEDLNRYL